MAQVSKKSTRRCGPDSKLATKGMPAKLSRLTLQQIESFLARHGFIAILWHIDDVKCERPELSKRQCMRVLEACKRNHDAGIAINWEVIRMEADDLFPASREDV